MFDDIKPEMYSLIVNSNLVKEGKLLRFIFTCIVASVKMGQMELSTISKKRNPQQFIESLEDFEQPRNNEKRLKMTLPKPQTEEK